MTNRPTFAVGLDIGTSRVRCVIGEVGDNAPMDIVGIGQAESRGLRRGVVVNTEAAVESIHRAVEEAERMSGLETQLVTINISGEHLQGRNSTGLAIIAGREREIHDDDVERAVDSASAVQLPTGWDIVDRLPQEFVVDGQDGITNPVGMSGTRLESRVHLVVGPGAGRQNSVKAVNRAGLKVEYLMLEQLAAAESALTDDDKEYGSALVNIGAEITGLVIYGRGSVQHTAVFPLGGSFFTKDIAHGLRVSPQEAERVKREFGSVAPFRLSDYERQEQIEVMPVGGRHPKQLSRQILCDMLQPRGEEILQHIADEVRKIIGNRQLSSGIVLTGGAANLSGMSEIAEQVFDAPTRLGYPERDRFGGLVEDLQDPAWATATGLALFSLKTQIAETQSVEVGKTGSGKFSALIQRLRDNFSSFF
ncbi:MAG TPA: cell division protein FtsA [Pyrinomonadaceae bacterium]|nr:cell division protein FtsA [Pyrinomonadaceae bacterium]